MLYSDLDYCDNILKGKDSFQVLWFKKKKKKAFGLLILSDARELGIAMSLYFPWGIQKPG